MHVYVCVCVFVFVCSSVWRMYLFMYMSSYGRSMKMLHRHVSLLSMAGIVT